MSSIDLSLFKTHCRADDFAGDDSYLQHLLDTAEAHIANATHRTMEELEEMGGGELPLPVVQAILLTGGHWYNQRESVSIGQISPVPETVLALIKPYTKLTYESGES